MDQSDPDVQALVSKVRNGIYPAMSFSFRVASASAETWSADGTQRSILAAELDGGDVSVVRNGANPTTEVSVGGAAAGAYEVRTAGGLIAVFERRQMGTDESDGLPEDAPDDAEVCPQCDGSGWQPDRVGQCAVCGGTGWVEPGGDEDDRAARGKYAAHELGQLGAQGKALAGPDGGWRYPVADREDLMNAVQDVARGKGDHDKIRKFIIGRARALGLTHLLPKNWKPDGSVLRSRPPTAAELRQRAERLRSQADEREVVDMIEQARRRRGLPAHDSLSEFRKYSQLAAAARARGDLGMAATYACIADQEAMACAVGL